jgi:hypothetical protein
MLDLDTAFLTGLPQQLLDAKIEFGTCFTPHYHIPGLLQHLMDSFGLTYIPP